MHRLLIAASGTGGHIFPALAVAEELSASWQVHWLGVPDRMETKLVPEKYHLVQIRVGGLQASGLRKFFVLFKLLFSTFRVWTFLRKEHINAVFTTGGYIAAPAILGAMFCGLPVILHESNAMPGKVTRLMGRFCQIVAIGFPIAAKQIPQCKVLFTGNPVRKEFNISQKLPAWVPIGEGPLIIVMGGSQGALGLNRMVRAVMPYFLDKGCRVVHLTGCNDPDFQKNRHPNLVEKLFCDEIAGLLQHADLAISRAGSGALCELAACGTPAILVPYPESADQHQEINAGFAASLGAAVVVHQHQPDEQTLGDTIFRLLDSRLLLTGKGHDWLLDMKEGMQRLAFKNADQALVQLIESFS